MNVARKLVNKYKTIHLIIESYREAVKTIDIDSSYTKDIFIDGSSLEIRYYHSEILVKVNDR